MRRSRRAALFVFLGVLSVSARPVHAQECSQISDPCERNGCLLKAARAAKARGDREEAKRLARDSIQASNECRGKPKMNPASASVTNPAPVSGFNVVGSNVPAGGGFREPRKVKGKTSEGLEIEMVEFLPEEPTYITSDLQALIEWGKYMTGQSEYNAAEYSKSEKAANKVVGQLAKGGRLAKATGVLSVAEEAVAVTDAATLRWRVGNELRYVQGVSDRAEDELMMQKKKFGRKR